MGLPFPVLYQLPRPAKLFFDDLSRWCHGERLGLLTPFRSAKVRAECKRLGTFLKGMLDGWQGSINACCVRDDVGVLLVLRYVEVHARQE